MRLALATLLVTLTAFAAPAQAPSDLARTVDAATAAYKTKDYAAFRDAMLRAHELAPERARFWYNLACAYALTGDADRAVQWLDRVAAAGLVYPAGDDADFAAIAKTIPFQAVLARLAANGAPVRTGERAFTLPERGFLAEGIAYDPHDTVFYVSSVRRRKIVRIDARGHVTDFLANRDELRSAFGIAVDAKRRRLWVTTAEVPQMLGYSAEHERRAALLAFELPSGRLAKSVAIPSDGAEHDVADLTVASNGNVYASDSRTGAIYRLRDGASALETLAVATPIGSGQGLALSTDGRRLYVADYIGGIVVVDLATLGSRPLSHPDDVCLSGIDGLAFANGSLYATQNGIRPKRVVRIALDAAGAVATKLEVLEASTPELGEPTLGVVANGWFYFNADSQWELYGPDGAAPAESAWRPHTVRRVKLWG